MELLDAAAEGERADIQRLFQVPLEDVLREMPLILIPIGLLGGSPEVIITAGDNVSLTGTARSATLAVVLNPAGPCRENGKTRVNWRDSQAWSNALSRTVLPVGVRESRFAGRLTPVEGYTPFTQAEQESGAHQVSASFPYRSQLRAPSLGGHYPASSVLLAHPPPCRPGLPLAGFRLPRARHRPGFPCCHAFHPPHVPTPLPRRKPARLCPVALFPASRRPSPFLRRVGSRI